MNEGRKSMMERMRTEAQYLQHEYVLLFSLAVVDATFLEYFSHDPEDNHAPQTRRSRRSEGSIRYTLRMGTGQAARDFADIDLRTIAPDKTYIAISLRPLPPASSDIEQTYFEGWCNLQLIRTIAWLWADQKRMAALAIKSPTPYNTIIPIDQDGKPRIDLGIQPAALFELEQIKADADNPFQAPQPTEYATADEWLEALNTHYETYEAPEGVKISAFAKRSGIAPQTLYNARDRLGKTRPRKQKKPSK
jgi:hypothetical protein